jgi:hypothetical protein
MKSAVYLRRLIIISLAVVFAAAAVLALRRYAYAYRPAFLVELKAAADAKINNLRLPRRPALPEGTDPGGTRFCDYAAGFAIDLPEKMSVDASKSPKFIEFTGETSKITVSRERVYGKDLSAYTGHYFNRFLLDGDYRAKNDLSLLQNEADDNCERLSIRLNNRLGAPFDTYHYIIIKTGTDIFYRILLRHQASDGGAALWAESIGEAFRYFRAEGTARYDTAYAPVPPSGWNAETKALYERIAQSDTVEWGIFTGDVREAGLDGEIAALEEKLDYRFSVVLTYIHQNWEFPADFFNRCYNDNKLVELTYQMTRNNNEDLSDRSPALDLLRYGDGEKIREFARAARDFGHPFLFRLNNEMNSDWTSYSGVVNLQDPDIYIQNWRTIYRIFEEEGVQNAIWVFNPNDDDYPPANWNSFIAYYPGDEYVQMIGVTGYNTGTYYSERFGERWREFEDIYDGIAADFSGVFDRFPWIITEFSSSSVGGDKEKWIRNMFGHIGGYPNIKLAVWFSYADYDPEREGVISRPYRLDETDATTKAFYDGLHLKGTVQK